MSSIDMAFTNAYNNTRDFAMRTFNLTEDQAITAITTVMDFAVTQVVDGMPPVYLLLICFPYHVQDDALLMHALVLWVWCMP